MRQNPSATLLLVVFIFCISTLHANRFALSQDERRIVVASVDSANDVTRAKLQKKTTIDASQTPLGELANKLAEKHDIQIILDQPTLDLLGITPDLPVTAILEDVPLDTAMRLVLEQLKLTYTLDSGIVRITSIDKAEDYLETRMYRVDRILDRLGSRHKDDEPVKAVAVCDEGCEQADCVACCRLNSAMPDNLRTARQKAADELIEDVTYTIAPETWIEMGGPGTIEDYGDMLVIRQTLRVHQQVEQYLQCLARLLEYEVPEGEEDNTIVSVSLTSENDLTREKLQQETEIDVIKTPLGELLDNLGKKHDLQIFVDVAALDLLGITTEMPITARLQGVSLEADLRQILGQIELTWAIDDGVLVITTKDKIHERLETRMVRVGPLMNYLPAYEWPDDLRSEVAALPGKFRRVEDDLMQCVTETIFPGVWLERGGSGTIVMVDDVMIIRQTAAIHRHVEQLLKRLMQIMESADGKSITSASILPTDDLAEAKLQQLVDLNLTDVPLNELCERLSKEYGVPLVVDVQSLKLLGIPANQCVTFRLKDVSLEATLRLLLEPLEMTYAMQDGIVVITSQDKIDDLLQTRVYCVQRLLDQMESGFMPDALPGKTYPQGIFFAGMSEDAIKSDAMHIPPQTARQNAAEALRDCIRDATTPCSWLEMGGSGTTFSLGDLLIVQQTPKTHLQIEWLLNNMLRTIEADMPGVILPMPPIAGKAHEPIVMKGRPKPPQEQNNPFRDSGANPFGDHSPFGKDFDPFTD